MRTGSLIICAMLLASFAIAAALVREGHWAQEMLRGMSGGVLLAMWGTRRDPLLTEGISPPWLLMGIFSAIGGLMGAFKPGSGLGLIIAGLMVCMHRMWENDHLARTRKKAADPWGPIQRREGPIA